MAKKSASVKVVEAFSGMKINQRGSKIKASEVLGVSRQLVRHWLLTGVIPTNRHSLILKTARKLNLELSAADLVNQ